MHNFSSHFLLLLHYYLLLFFFLLFCHPSFILYFLSSYRHRFVYLFHFPLFTTWIQATLESLTLYLDKLKSNSLSRQDHDFTIYVTLNRFSFLIRPPLIRLQFCRCDCLRSMIGRYSVHDKDGMKDEGGDNLVYLKFFAFFLRQSQSSGDFTLSWEHRNSS